MKVLVLLFLAAMHTVCVAAEEGSGSGNDSVLVIEDAVGEGNETVLPTKLDLHCFTCTTLTDPKCGDPFDGGVAILPYSGKSVCFKFKRDDFIFRGGMLDAEYLQLYEDGLLEDYPIRFRCSDHLCNDAPRAASLSPLWLLLLTALLGSRTWQ